MAKTDKPTESTEQVTPSTTGANGSWEPKPGTVQILPSGSIRTNAGKKQ